MTWKLTITASKDIEEILRYTKETWNFDQAKAYGLKIFERFDELSKTPLIGTNADYIFPLIKKFSIGQHLIFYILKTETIVILRVLHTSMDVENQTFSLD